MLTQTFPSKPLRVIVPSIAGSALDVRAQATATGTEVVGRRPEEFAAFIRLEIVKWGGIIKDAGIKPQRYRYLCIMRITLPISEKESSNASEEFGEA